MLCIYIHPTGGGHIIYAFSASAVRHAWFPVISREHIYPIFTKFGMGVYFVFKSKIFCVLCRARWFWALSH